MIRFISYDINDAVGMKAVENDKEIGCCSFRINGFDMEFISVECSDDIITEGLARAAMNYAANRNAYIARIAKENVSPAFLRLGFTGEDILSVEIPVALTSGCSCRH